MKSKLIETCWLVISIATASMCLNCFLMHLLEKETYNREFDVKVYQHTIKVFEGHTDAKNDLRELIEGVDVNRLDEKAKDLMELTKFDIWNK